VFLSNLVCFTHLWSFVEIDPRRFGLMTPYQSQILSIGRQVIANKWCGYCTQFGDRGATKSSVRLSVDWFC
jgi:hypothetical protein